MIKEIVLKDSLDRVTKNQKFTNDILTEETNCEYDKDDHLISRIVSKSAFGKLIPVDITSCKFDEKGRLIRVITKTKGIQIFEYNKRVKNHDDVDTDCYQICTEYNSEDTEFKTPICRTLYIKIYEYVEKLGFDEMRETTYYLNNETSVRYYLNKKEVTEITYNKDNECIFKANYSYDDKGRMILAEGEDTSRTFRTTYEYDNPIDITDSSHESTVNGKIFDSVKNTFGYNDKGLFHKTHFLFNFDSEYFEEYDMFFQYDKNNRLIESWTTRSNERTIYAYDEAGNEIFKKVTPRVKLIGRDSPTTYKLTKYKDQNNIVSFVADGAENLIIQDIITTTNTDEGGKKQIKTSVSSNEDDNVREHYLELKEQYKDLF